MEGGKKRLIDESNKIDEHNRLIDEGNRAREEHYRKIEAQSGNFTFKRKIE